VCNVGLFYTQLRTAERIIYDFEAILAVVMATRVAAEHTDQ
jgi:hypothetical protein